MAVAVLDVHLPGEIAKLSDGELWAEIVAICKECNVVVGHPHVEVSNGQRIVDEGYRFLMCSAPRSFNTLEKSRTLVGR